MPYDNLQSKDITYNEKVTVKKYPNEKMTSSYMYIHQKLIYCKSEFSRFHDRQASKKFYLVLTLSDIFEHSFFYFRGLSKFITSTVF